MVLCIGFEPIFDTPSSAAALPLCYLLQGQESNLHSVTAQCRCIAIMLTQNRWRNDGDLNPEGHHYVPDGLANRSNTIMGPFRKNLLAPSVGIEPTQTGLGILLLFHQRGHYAWRR